jgi:hypothetical protein
MDKATYVRQLMATRLRTTHAEMLAQACLVYWHSGVDINTAGMYLQNYHNALIRGNRGSRD